MISIIVPVYKVEKYVGKCIESILAQTFRDLELILVDDGTPDNSGAICDEYAQKDSRIKVFHKENGGVSSARNYGIEKATGEWICFVDSDDWLESTYLEDFDISGGQDLLLQGYKKKFNKGNLKCFGFEDCKCETFPEILAYTELHYIINSPCFKLFKKQIINENNIKFDKNTSYGEDHLFVLDYLMHINSINYSYQYGYIYTVGMSDSLNHRIVPLKEILYYTRMSHLKHKQLLDKLQSEKLSYAYRKIYENNIVRVFRSFFGNRGSCDDFNRLLKEFEFKELNSVRKMTGRHILMFALIKYAPVKISYEILSKLL